jgi:hypothetical protein
MKKIVFLLAMITILTGPFLSVAHSGDVKLQIKNIQCVENGKIVVSYGLINTYGFEYPNVTLGFKVTDQGTPLGCKRLHQSIPKDADGSTINELVIEAPCSSKVPGFEYVVFTGGVSATKVDEWFSGCN